MPPVLEGTPAVISTEFSWGVLLWVQFNSTPIKSPPGPSESVFFLSSGRAESCSICRLKEQQKRSVSGPAIMSASPHSSRHWALASHILHYNTDWEIPKRYSLQITGKAEGRNMSFFLAAMFHVIGIPLAGVHKSILLICECPIN